MNRALLSDLQRRRCYPSLTLLLNTAPGVGLDADDHVRATHLIEVLDRRLGGDVPDETRQRLIARLTTLLTEQTTVPASHALALFVSPELSTAVRIGRAVDERVTVDDTFTTRDLVADLDRAALFRLLTLSERSVRLLIGDGERLVEQRDDTWPFIRNDEHTDSTWTRDVSQLLRADNTRRRLPTVLAGVQRTVSRHAPLVDTAVGTLSGNHDRTTAVDLHRAGWPMVSDWLRANATRTLDRLGDARSTNRYAGGIHEIWPLANDGRIATLVVEAGYTLPARIDSNHQLHPAVDREHPEVNDDVVDDTIEAVLRHGGEAVIVSDGALADNERIAAVLRY